MPPELLDSASSTAAWSEYDQELENVARIRRQFPVIGYSVRMGQATTYRLVDTSSRDPSIRDIAAVFDDDEISDAEAAELDIIMAQGRARATVPPLRLREID
jgi:hypothetical protein